MLRIGKLHLGAGLLAAFSAVALLAAGPTSAQAAGCVPGNTADPWYIGCASELTWNYSLAQINANGAYTRGYTGQGVIVAVFDSGLDTGDNQFIGRIAGPGYDAVTGTVGVTSDVMWHGTFVSGVIAANRDGIGMMGVAYNAQLLPIRIVNPDGSITLSDSNLAAGINYATTHGARVFNNSWNSSAPISWYSKATLAGALPQELKAWDAAVVTSATNPLGAIVVFAAGNDGKSQPGFYAALPTDFPELKAGWVAAVATDSTGRIASYSDRCGSAAAWCIAAPGSNIISVYNRGYGSASGTSFAAPEVSGAAAILMQDFPYLTNSQILQILFQSATKAGIYANQSIYGQGLLNLDSATKPVGTVVVPKTKSVGGSATQLAVTGASMGSAFGARFSKSLSSQPLLVLDSFNRGYTVQMSGVVRGGTDSFFNLTRALDAFGGRDMETEQTDTTTLHYAFAVQPQSGGADGRVVPGKFSLTTQLDATHGLNIGYNVSPALAFGAYGQGVVDHADLLMDGAVSIPYLDFADKAYSVAYSSKVGALGTLKLGAFAGQAKSSPFEDDSYYDPSRDPRMAGVYGTVAELSVPIGGSFKLGLDGGMVLEQGTFLGTMSDGAVAFGQNIPTYFAGLTATAKLGATYSVFGGMQMGLSTPSGSPGSMIQNATSVVTQSFNLGVAKNEVFGKQDQAGFVFSQPLRAMSGSANLNLPVSRDYFGNLTWTSTTAPLAADGRELDLQGFYRTPVTDGASLNLGAMLRLQPDNVRSAPPAGVALAQFQVKF